MTGKTTDIEAPLLSGKSLAILTGYLEGPFPGRGALARSMLDRLGIPPFRSRSYEESPRFQPLVSGPQGSASRPVSPGDTRAVRGALGAAAGSGSLPSVLDYCNAYLEKKTTPREVAEKITATIERDSYEGARLHAFIAWEREEILRQAEESTRRIADGTARSILEGVPVAIKDELDVAGFPTTVGTAFLRAGQKERDATVVRRLREGGAVILGKTNMHEIGIGVTGLNPFYGTPLNPFDPGRYPGGSSSGSGAVVGAGLCPIALGADGGGSVRVPAAFCGVFGLKMTWGRVSVLGEYPLGYTVGNNGPIAATARDLALAYAFTAGEDPGDASTMAGPPPTLDGFLDDLEGVRIGVCTPWFEDCRTEVAQAGHALLERLSAAGARIVEIEIPELEELRVAHMITITLEMSTSMAEYLRAGRHLFGLETRMNLALARHLTTADYIKAQQVRARMMNHLEGIFQAVDIIATPTTANLPPLLHGGRNQRGVSDLKNTLETIRFTAPANMTGNPAVTVPAAFLDIPGSRHPVPVGLQCIGRHWEEPLLLRVARIAEECVDRPRPAVYLAPLQPSGSTALIDGAG